MSLRKVVAGCVLGVLSLAPAAFGQGVPPALQIKPAIPTDSVQSFINDITNPADGVKWGYDLRVREEYCRNCYDLDDQKFDDSNAFRFRNRLWMELGPYLTQNIAGIPNDNGISFYVRLVYEPRVYTVVPDYPPALPNQSYPTTWNEVALDNLYVNLNRFMGMPVSLKIGRQDIQYGKGLVILEGTPLDGSRTQFFDAIKGTIHLDEISTNVDLIYADNKARESRVTPLNVGSSTYLSEYNTTVVGAYAISKIIPDQEIHGYWLYHHDELVIPKPLPNKKDINTMGALMQGKFAKSFDYYVEGAGQWGRIDGQPMGDAWAFSSDVGYTLEGTEATPVRVHGGYEYLSGDDNSKPPAGGRSHGWDSTLTRFPRWSELYACTWMKETGMAGFETNLQRYIAGASYKPIDALLFTFDYNLLLDNNSTTVPGFMSGMGQTRGNLFMGKMFYQITPYIGGHLWAEYFLPSKAYVSTSDPAWFLRWEVTFTLANQTKKK